MAIVAADIKFKLPAAVSDAASNGGRITNTTISTFFPNITGAERGLGITRYRKGFLKNEQASGGYTDLTLYNPKVYLESLSPGEDYYRLVAGTSTDVQSNATGYTAWAGVGFLDADIAGGAANFDVNAEHASGFEDGATLVIADGTNREVITLTSKSWVSTKASLVTSGVVNAYARAYDTRTATTANATEIGSNLSTYLLNEHYGRLVRIKSGTGAGQIRRIASNTTNGVLTVTFPFATTPVVGDSEYEILKTYVSQTVNLADAVCALSGWAETSTLGTYNEATYPVLMYPVGTVDQTWTITFSNATTYNVDGSSLGRVVTGQAIAANCTPSNVGSTSYYFNLRAAGWGGTWAGGDTIVFTTAGSYKGFWCKQVVTAGIATCGDNTWNIRAIGDSV